MRRWVAVLALEAFICVRVSQVPQAGESGCVHWVPEGTVIDWGTPKCQSWRMTGRPPSLSCEWWIRVPS